MNLLKTVLLFVLSGLLAVAAEYSRQIRGPLNEIRKDVAKNGRPCLQGFGSGYPGHAGAFITNFRKIDGNSTMQDIVMMLKDTNPVVRLVGARIAMNNGLDPELLTALETDSTPLWVGPFNHQKGEFRQMTVQEVLVEMQNDPLFQLRVDYGGSSNWNTLKPWMNIPVQKSSWENSLNIPLKWRARESPGT